MTILDIREDNTMHSIIYDESGDLILLKGGFIAIQSGSKSLQLADKESFDDFIKALYKAKELWLDSSES